ncbi:MAG TPA: universal stress protein [Anaerolineae bacterium]
MLRKMLVPLDGSALAEQVLSPALALARAARAEVVLLRSIIPVYAGMPNAHGEYSWMWPDDAREDGRREASEYLEMIQLAHQEASFNLRVLVQEGDAARMIVDSAYEEDADVIIMPAQDAKGAGTETLDGVTEQVLRRAPCPVLLIHSDRPIARVLITLDGSDLAEHALEPGLELAVTLGAKVTLLRVVEPTIIGVEEATLQQWRSSPSGHRMRTYLHESSAAYLNEVVLRYGLGTSGMQTAVIDGPAVDGILDFSRRHEIDLIAMCTHGYTGFRGWTYGSVTANVICGSDCSMLIVRPPAYELEGRV